MTVFREIHIEVIVPMLFKGLVFDIVSLDRNGPEIMGIFVRLIKTIHQPLVRLALGEMFCECCFRFVLLFAIITSHDKT